MATTFSLAQRPASHRAPAWVRARAVCAAALGVLVILGAASPAWAQASYTTTRNVSFQYLANGLLQSETVEPNDPQLCVTTTYLYDAAGNRASSTTANCPTTPAGSTALFAPRAAETTFGSYSFGYTVGSTSIVLPVPAGLFATKTRVALAGIVAAATSHEENREYDPRFGAATKLTGPNGLVTTWAFDDFGRRVLETRADGTRSETDYCYIGNLVVGAPANSANCNAHGFATNEIPAAAVLYEHNVSKASNNTALGPFSRVYYDRAGRAIRSVSQGFDGTAPAGTAARLVVQDTDHNKFGAAHISTAPYYLDTGSTVSSAAANTSPAGLTKTDYDLLGRPVRIYTTEPVDARETSGNVRSGGSQLNIPFVSISINRGTHRAAVVQMAYNGLQTTITDDKNRTRVEEKNPEGNVVRTTDGLGAQVVHQHDAYGNLLQTVDPLGNKIYIEYDQRGRKTRLLDPDAGVTVYCYDAAGQLKAQQTANMRGSNYTAAGSGSCPSTSTTTTVAPTVTGWTTFAYDGMGRMTERLEPEYRTVLQYDTCAQGKGKLCQSTTSHGITRTNTYDSLGRPRVSKTEVASAQGQPVQMSATSAVTYDTVTGRVSAQIYPTGVSVSPVYSNLGFMRGLQLNTAVTVAPRPATPGGTAAAGKTLAANTLLWEAQAVSAAGGAERTRLDSTVFTEATRDPQTGRLLRLQAGKSASRDEVADQRAFWDSANQLTRRVDARGDGTGIEVSDTYTYDTIGRLASYQVAGGAAGAPVSTRSVTLQYNALGMLLYKSDVGIYSYPTQGQLQGNGTTKPHAVQSIAGIHNASYSYDLNGNVTAATGGRYRSVAYTSFNLPDSSAGLQGPAGSPKYTWKYDEGHARIQETRLNSQGTRVTWYLHPDNVGGLGFEREEGPGATGLTTGAQNRHYLSAGASIGVLVTAGVLPSAPGAGLAPPVLISVNAVKLEYWHKDHLGSLVATSDHNGNVTARYAYDPFGKRRLTNSSYDPFGNVVVDWTSDTNAGTDRGYTGHEHLDDVGVIHMNGRIFDPLIARFMQADPLIQDPGNLQNYDRYAYCYNNPGNCTDPSGYKSLKQFFRAADTFARRPTIQHAHGVLRSVPGQASIDRFFMNNPYAYAAAKIVVAYFTFGLGAAGMDAYYNYERTGSASSAVKGFAIAAATAWAMNAVGNATTISWDTGFNASVGEYWNAGTSVNIPANVLGHAVVGGVSSLASGGNFKSGALAGAFGSVMSNSGLYSEGNRVLSVMQHAAVGGVGSVLGGGKFADGAVTAAFGYLFNQAAHAARAGAATAAGGVAAAGPSLGERIALAVDQAAARVGDVVDYIFKSDSVVLARNMVQETDLSREPGQHAHHIVAANDPRADPARTVLGGVGMSINSAFNGVFLNPSQHAQIHTDVYYNSVNLGLTGATTYADVALRLTAMRAAIQAGTFPR
jgi:RHS repeat-associated protein